MLTPYLTVYLTLKSCSVHIGCIQKMDAVLLSKIKSVIKSSWKKIIPKGPLQNISGEMTTLKCWTQHFRKLWMMSKCPDDVQFFNRFFQDQATCLEFINLIFTHYVKYFSCANDTLIVTGRKITWPLRKT